MQKDGKNIYLYDLGISRQFERELYDVFLIQEVIKDLFEKGTKKILVSVDSAVEANWYKKFNFRSVSVYEHWNLLVPEDPLKKREKNLEKILLNFQYYQIQDDYSSVFQKH